MTYLTRQLFWDRSNKNNMAVAAILKKNIDMVEVGVNFSHFF